MTSPQKFSVLFLPSSEEAWPLRLAVAVVLHLLSSLVVGERCRQQFFRLFSFVINLRRYEGGVAKRLEAGFLLPLNTLQEAIFRYFIISKRSIHYFVHASYRPEQSCISLKSKYVCAPLDDSTTSRETNQQSISVLHDFPQLVSKACRSTGVKCKIVAPCTKSR